MVPVDAKQRLNAGRKEPCRLPGSVPACISHVAAVCFSVCSDAPAIPARLHAAANAFLMSPMPLAVDVQYVGKIGPALPRAPQMR